MTSPATFWYTSEKLPNGVTQYFIWVNLPALLNKPSTYTNNNDVRCTIFLFVEQLNGEHLLGLYSNIII